MKPIKKDNMKYISQNIFRTILSVAAFSAVTLTASAEREFLIKNAAQLSTNATNSVGELDYLIDDKKDTHWSSGTTYTGGEHYLQVDLGEDIQLNPDNEDIVIYTRRHNDTGGVGHKMHPIIMLVQVSTDGNNWESFSGEGTNNTHVYFPYRGYETKEYSTRITTGKTFRYIRFTVEANNSSTYVTGSNTLRCMDMAEFQIIKLGRNDNYTDTQIDRFRMTYDYRLCYEDYGFEYTRGPIDERNRGNGHVPNDYTDWGKWNADGKWVETDEEMKDLLEKQDIKIPEMSFITSADDPDVGSGQKRQRTHVTEHDLYAVPGDAIALYPYYDMWTSTNYVENFSHWYNYKTGGHVMDNDGNYAMDFLIDPSEIYRTKNHGFIGGKGVLGETTIKGEFLEIRTADDLIAFANRVNGGETALHARIMDDLDFTGKTFVQIGTEANPYSGVFHGMGHTLSNITINGNTYYTGMFGYVTEANICYFTLASNCTISGNNVAGGIVGYYNNTTNKSLMLKGIVNNATVSGKTDVGGLIGACYNDGEQKKAPAIIDACAVTGTIISSNQAAPMAGWCAAKLIVSNSWSIADVQCTEKEYGFSRGNNTTMENCFSTNNKNLPDGVTLLNGGLSTIKNNLEGNGWVYHENNELTSVYATPDNYYYIINNVDQFIEFAQKVNAGTPTLNARITSDLDFTGKNFVSIGTAANPYSGNFDGGGHTLSNINITSDGNSSIFTEVGGAHISNFILDNTCTISGARLGGVVSHYVNGATSDLVIEGIIQGGNITGNRDVSGIFGYCESDNSHRIVINACAVTGNITSTNAGNLTGQAAPMVGWSMTQTSISNSYSIAYITCDDYGFARTSGNITVTNCYSNRNSDNWIGENNGLTVFDGNTANIKDNLVGQGWDNNLRPSNTTFVTIKNVDEYIAFARRVNAGETTLGAILFADIDFEGKEYVAIGTENNPYNGTFDGCQHTLRNININDTITSTDGRNPHITSLFNYVSGGVICNMVLDESCSITGRQVAAGLVGRYVNDAASTLTIEGIINHGSVTGTSDVGGIVGIYWGGAANQININACAVTGKITNSNNGTRSAMVGWSNATTSVTNSWSIADIDTNVGGNNYGFARGGSMTIKNCFSNKKAETGVTLFTETDFSIIGYKLDGKGWSSYPSVVPQYSNKFENFPDRKYGAVAIFFYPRSPYTKGGEQTNLGEKEYVIAADFSATFDYRKNIDHKEKKFIEPTILFRHIFRIHDGRDFAEEFSGSPDKNKEYIQKHLRNVTARAGVDFQIRMESPIPVELEDELVIRSKWYYKINDNDYRRVGSGEIVVYNADSGEEINDHGFNFAETFDGAGSRVIDGTTYNFGGGGGKYYRMLACPADKAKAGRYTIKIYAHDHNKKRIKICDGNGGFSDEDLLIQELHLTFLPEQSAFMMNADDMDDSKYFATEEYLQQTCGDPRAIVDYDKYRLLENKPVSGNYFSNGYNGAKFFKWPVEWNQSNYGFGFNATTDNSDYSIYRIANHSSMVPYKDAASKYPADKNFGKGAGLYDRLFYDTKGKESGYFYYVNAASDPGIMARMTIDKLCMGSTLHVSAYLAEFSDTTEVANLAFNFVAVLKTTHRRITLHTFTSGYVTTNGVWQKIYYSFVPAFADAGITSEEIDHYELELDNNSKTSVGADYAIDNIRVYVTRPAVYAKQTAPICNQEHYADVKIEIPFDVLMQTVGKTEVTDEKQAEEVPIYYTFLDKAIYDKAIAAHETGEKAFEAALLQYKYNEAIEAEKQTFGKIVFSNYYMKNSEYINEVESSAINTPMRQNIDGVRHIVFNTRPENDALKAGKEYIIAIYSPTSSIAEVTNPGSSEFDVGSPCAKTCVFRVKASGIIKIDGVVVPDQDAITCCENQQPVVQIDLQGKKNDTNNFETIDPNARFDWYSGTREEFDAEMMTDGSVSLTLFEVLANFREVYPTAADAMVELKEGGIFTKEMRDYLLQLTTPVDNKPAKLSLYSSSYVFPPVKIPEGENHTYVQVLAVPINIQKENYLFCAEPTEVRILVTRHAPDLAHGLNLTYPDYMYDVPLRIGLNQLEVASAENPEDATSTLNIPVRRVMSTSEKFTKMMFGADRNVYLAETNDPEYKDLGVTADNTGLMAIGYVKDFVADNGNKEFGTNIIRVAFKKSFRFKESYYYRFTFDYDEELGNASVDENEMPCSGRHIVTMKIVPEYAKWVGKTASLTSLNWNNDKNWERVSSADLYRAQDKDDRFTTDGSNEATFSYAPLDFTKTIIPGNAEYPYMYAAKETKDITVNYNGDGINSTFVWPVEPEDEDENSPAGKPVDLIDLIKGGATHDLQYDMTAFAVDNKAGIYCRTWYMNTCEQIHFKPESQIFNQQHLVYERAWVDMEMAPAMWHTVASPLQGIIAGDMYLPSDGARQKTELFKDITFAYGTNDRFKPAVFQRSWNKATANVYELKDKEQARNVAVATKWSHVYNDVKERYSAGNGFSVKPDLTRMADESKPEKVLFRLPKADTEYDYYDVTGQEIGDKTNVAGLHANMYRLNDTKDATVTINAAESSKYFLVGNPFMSQLDMAKFLKENSGVIESKYWVLTDNNQTVAIMDENGLTSVGENDVKNLNPMQGFFVEAKNSVASLDVKFNEGMMVKSVITADNTDPDAPSNRNSTRATFANEEENKSLVISAKTADGYTSTALLRVNEKASCNYRNEEDVMLLTHPEMNMPASVYTVTDGKAVSINTLPDPESTEVGIETLEEQDMTLQFDHTDCVSGYMLYDSEQETYTPITEGMVYTVKAGSKSRFFITAGNLSDDADVIRITTTNRTVTVNTTRGQLDVKVYDTLGRSVASVQKDVPEVNITLSKGVYIVEANDGVETVTRKIIL